MTIDVAVGRVRPDQAHRGVGGGREPGGDLDRDPAFRRGEARVGDPHAQPESRGL